MIGEPDADHENPGKLYGEVVVELKRRKLLRLKDYDYSQAGGYFLTICTHGRKTMFGEIIDGEMRLSSFGDIVKACWEELPHHYQNIQLDEFVVMPNHVHGIIIIFDDDMVRAGLRPAPTGGKPYPLSEIVRAFKSFSARGINALRNTPGVPVWQRNYFEHVIRSEKSLHRIQEYIIDNAMRWDFDRENSESGAIDEFEAWLMIEGTKRPKT